MIFAEKLIQLRKKSGWSQEELADQLQVSRQSVSKWEGAQSMPDLERLVQMSRLFGVSVDYLLKDEQEEVEYAEADPADSCPRVSLAQAQDFLARKAANAWPTAVGVLLCILSPICLLLLAACSAQPGARITENLAAALGLSVLLLLVAMAVALFVRCGQRTAAYEWMEKETFGTEYGVTALVRQLQDRQRPSYERGNVTGICLCVLSAVPLFLGLAVKAENLLLWTGLLCVTLAVVAVGVLLLVHGGIVWGSYQMLLQEGDYTANKKRSNGLMGAVSVIYWCAATALFLVISFTWNNWDRSWIVWAVAGILYPGLMAVLWAMRKK